MRDRMNKYLKILFLNRSLGYKFNVVFALAAFVPMLLLAYTSYKVIDSRLIADANERLKIGLEAAWTEYYIRADQMRYGMLQAAAQEEIKKAVRNKDAQYLADIMGGWKARRPYVDAWIIVDERGKVISRLNGSRNGDSVEINGVVEKALASGKSQTSTEVLPEEMLDGEGEEFRRQFAPPRETGDGYSAGPEGDVMALVVVTPVVDASRETVGAIVTADVLNNDPHLPDVISNKLPWLSASISLNGRRITTGIREGDGGKALWTHLPASIVSRLGPEKTVTGGWEYHGQEFISIFEPIKDGKGKVIGSLDIGMSKSRIWAVQKENLAAMAIITFIALALSMTLASITTFRVMRPLKILKERADAFARGDVDIKIEADMEPGSSDELAMLAWDINAMMEEIRSRNRERDLHLRELEEKNSQLAELNDRLESTNEKLEISYEELQSQTEELNVLVEELRVTNEELTAKNAELVEANERVKKEKEEQKALTHRLAQAEKLSSIGEIVSGVAHELNNPLSVIIGFSDILLDRDLPGSSKKQMEMISEAAHRSKKIIENLLTFARSHKPEKRYADLNRVIRCAVELKKHQLKADNIDVALDLDPRLPGTMLDEHQFQQVFVNLINNSHDAILEKKGGGRITISTSLEGDVIRARVADTGKGIPDDILEKMYDPFFTTKDVGKGTGLGLSISYGIIKEHGGDIYAESRLNEGAAFVIEMPVVRMTEEGREAASDTEERPVAAKRRVLVIDDEPGMLMLLKEQLLSLGHHVDTAETGDEAFAMLQKASYDLITSDIKMGGMNGKEFFDRLKSIRPEMADKVIFISGDTVSRETQGFLKETGRPLLKKPFAMKEFRGFISKHI
jgi:signal transduction histidine kinase/HAMP domain-containing protein